MKIRSIEEITHRYAFHTFHSRPHIASLFGQLTSITNLDKPFNIVCPIMLENLLFNFNEHPCLTKMPNLIVHIFHY
jgi:hypothetical protein